MVLRTMATLAGLFLALSAAPAVHAVKPECARPYTLALHDHGLLYSADTDSGIDKDVAAELTRRSGCKVTISLMPRARIWQLIESGALDFSLSGIATAQREQFAAFAWYFSNHYYLLVRNSAGVATQQEFEDNPALQLGVIRSFRYSASANRFVDGLMSANRVSQAGGLGPLYLALMAGQVQGMIIEPFDFPALDEKKIRAATTILEFKDPAVPHGLIMSKKSLSAAEQEAWRGLIVGMRSDGTMRRIFEKYFKPELASEMTGMATLP